LVGAVLVPTFLGSSPEVVGCWAKLPVLVPDMVLPTMPVPAAGVGAVGVVGVVVPEPLVMLVFVAAGGWVSKGLFGTVVAMAASQTKMARTRRAKISNRRTQLAEVDCNGIVIFTQRP
jgi:hypothetical protein